MRIFYMFILFTLVALSPFFVTWLMEDICGRDQIKVKIMGFADPVCVDKPVAQ